MFKAGRFLSLIHLIHIVSPTVAHRVRVVGLHKARVSSLRIPNVFVDVQILKFLVYIILTVVFGGSFRSTSCVDERSFWSSRDDFFRSVNKKSN